MSPRNCSYCGRRRGVDLLPPAGAGPRCQRARQGREDGTGIAHQRHVDRHVLADLGRVELDVDNLRVTGKARGVAGHAVVEAHAHRDEQVGMLDGAIDVHFAVHARHAEMQRMILGERADAEQRGDDRNAGVLGEDAQVLARVAEDDAVSGEDERTLGLRDEPRGVGERPGFGHRRRRGAPAPPRGARTRCAGSARPWARRRARVRAAPRARPRRPCAWYRPGW